MSRLPSIGGDGRARRIAAVAGLALAQALCAGLIAFATRDVFAALHGAADLPLPALAAIAAGGCAIAGLRIVERSVAERVGCDYAAAVRERLFLHVARTPPSVLARRRRGGLALRFVGDLAAVRGWIAQGLARLIAASITLPASVAVLFLLDARLALWAGLVLGAALAVMLALSPPLARAHRRLRRIRARLAMAMTERLTHGAALRLVGRVAAERARLAARATALADRAVARAQLTGTVRAIPDAAAALAAAAILATAATTGLQPATAAGALAALGLAIQPLRQLADVADRRQAWRVATAQIARALDAPALPERRGPRSTPIADAPPLCLKAVRIGDAPPLDLTIEPGEIALLEAVCATDRNTLLLAAAGIETGYRGRIRIFGLRPSTLPTATVAYIGPSAPLLRGTLARNLRLGGERADAAAQDKAATSAQLDALMHRLGGPQGRIAENGEDISAAERAHLLLGRAMLSPASLILLDAEALGLDEASVRTLSDRIRARGAAALIGAPPEWQADFADRVLSMAPASRCRQGVN